MWLYPSHLYMLAKELEQKLAGKSINDLFLRPHQGRYYISVGRPSERLVLLFVPSGKACRLSMVDSKSAPAKKELKSVPFPLRGCRISGCRVVNFDRILCFDIITNDKKPMELYVILIPRMGNLVVAERNSSIADWFLLNNKAISNKRLTLPQAPLIPSPYQIDKEIIANKILDKPRQNTANFIGKNIRGIDTRTAMEIAVSIGLKPETEVSELNESQIDRICIFMPAFNRELENGYMAVEYNDSHPEKLFISFRTDSKNENVKLFESPSKAIEIFAVYLETEYRFIEKRKSLLGLVSKKLKKNKKLLDQLNASRNDYENAGLYRKYGDLLLTNPDIKTKGNDMVQVEDVFVEESPLITIEVDSSKTNSENAEVYYKRSQKARKGLALVEKRISEIEDKLETDQQAHEDLENAANLEELDIIQSKYPDLSKSYSSGKKPLKTVKEPDFKYREYELGEGIKALVGKDSKDNERLTFGWASKNDLWLHVQQSAGSHVVLKRPHKKYEFPISIISRAASIAAYYSKERNAATVPVVYTLVKYVRKIKGGPPGKVHYYNEKSILVEPVDPDGK